jgi:hypothetical protein
MARRRTTARTAGAESAAEQCELCSAAVPTEHRHLLDVEARRLICACRACSVLFDNASAGGRHYRLLPDRIRALHPDPQAADLFWAELAIPVDLAFLFFDTSANRMVALYPGPMGATESQLPLGAWETLARENAPLSAMQPDVEALLVNRTRDRSEHWIVPIDVCYSLAGVIRTHWKGLGGGDVVWAELERFFTSLRGRALEERIS